MSKSQGNENLNCLLYDGNMPIEQIKGFKNTYVFDANPCGKACIGCFGCWVKTPGKCVINDRINDYTNHMLNSKELIIVTPCLYGGYSTPIKTALDRSIGFCLPYFKKYKGEMHHVMRFGNLSKVTVCFYGAVSENEKETAKKLVKANAMNFNCEQYSVDFKENFKEALEAVR